MGSCSFTISPVTSWLPDVRRAVEQSHALFVAVSPLFAVATKPLRSCAHSAAALCGLTTPIGGLKNLLKGYDWSHHFWGEQILVVPNPDALPSEKFGVDGVRTWP